VSLRALCSEFDSEIIKCPEYGIGNASVLTLLPYVLARTLRELETPISPMKRSRRPGLRSSAGVDFLGPVVPGCPAVAGRSRALEVHGDISFRIPLGPLQTARTLGLCFHGQLPVADIGQEALESPGLAVAIATRGVPENHCLPSRERRA
jgi:hypothetical protein